MRSRSPVVGFAAVALLLATSCGGDDEASGSGETQTEAGAAGTAVELSGADQDEFDRDARFVWAARTMPRSLNPHLTPFTGGSVPALTMLHDRLTYMNPYTGEIEPMLATSWEASDDGTSITFTLRDDVTFHDDGSPMDADAVVANFDYGKGLGDAHPEAASYDLIESAEVVDELTVRYHLEGDVAGAIPELMSGGLGMPVNPESFDRDDHAEHDAGTGPYMVSEIRPGQQITQVPYDDYWDPSAQNMGELVITLEENEDTVLNGVSTGQIDASSLASTIAARAEATPDIQVVNRVGNSAWVIFINTELTDMQDDRVRLALNHAVDREALAELALQGNCEPTVQPWNDGHRAHNPDYPPDYYEYDPDRARELLAEAGFPDGLAFEIDTYTMADYVPVSELLQSQMAEAGFDVTIRQIDTAQLSPGFRTERTLDTWFTRTPFGQPTIRSITSYWLPNSPSNPGGWQDEELVEIHAELLGEDDPDRQDELLQRVTSRLVEAPSSSLILCHDRVFYIGGDDVLGLEPNPTGFMDFRRMGKRQQ